MINHPRRSKQAISATPASLKKSKPVHDHDTDYAALLGRVRAAFNRVRHLPLFETDAELWPLYLKSIVSKSERQIHDCHACKSFMKHFGGLATIDDEGHLLSAMWNPPDAPSFYLPTVNALNHAVSRAKVIGPFASTEIQWGKPFTDAWTHSRCSRYLRRFTARSYGRQANSWPAAAKTSRMSRGHCSSSLVSTSARRCVCLRPIT